MDRDATKNVIESALLAAGKPLSFDRIVEIFVRKRVDVDRSELRAAITALGDDYASRGIELKEVASGFRVQVRSQMRDWLEPLFEERAPRYTRALLETLALVAYRQPITRAEIEEIRGVAVSSNIVRTLIERGWIRVVGYRDVPGKPSMLGTTREFLDYFGLRRLEDLPPLAELRELDPGANLQSDLIDRLEAGISAEAGPSGRMRDEDALEDESMSADDSAVVAPVAIGDSEVSDEEPIDGTFGTADAGVENDVAADSTPGTDTTPPGEADETGARRAESSS